MSSNSPIEWLLGGATWNWLVGCAFASEGCLHCWALIMTRRLAGSLGGVYADAIDDGRWSGRVLLREDKLSEPEHWAKPRLVFVNSMSDTFHENVPDAWLDRAFDVMERADWHTYLLLTKRAKRMREYLSRRYPDGVPKHIWAGVSVCNQDDADRHVPPLLEIRAAVLFLSCEPLVGPVALDPFWLGCLGAAACDRRRPDKGATCCAPPCPPRIGWVIAGGEGGPGARACGVTWIRSLVQQCGVAHVPAYVKQLGAYVAMDEEAWRAEKPMRLLDHRDAALGPGRVRLCLPGKKGQFPDSWPADLRVREMPEADHA